MSKTLESGTFSILRILNLKRERDEARREAVKLFAELEAVQQKLDKAKKVLAEVMDMMEANSLGWDVERNRRIEAEKKSASWERWARQLENERKTRNRRNEARVNFLYEGEGTA